MIKKIFEFGLFPVYRALVLFLFPTSFCCFFFRGLMVDVKIGFSLLIVRELHLASGTRIGSFNLIRCEALECESHANISRINTIVISGRIILGNSSSIGNRNKITSPICSKVYVNKGGLHLGAKAIITSDHFFDLTDSIVIGENTVIAGKNSEFWTHSYIHSNYDRFRVDGAIIIGGNSYIGSRSIFLASSGIAGHSHIGAGTIISKVYKDEDKIIISSRTRVLDFVDNRINMNKISNTKTCEEVYAKN